MASSIAVDRTYLEPIDRSISRVVITSEKLDSGINRDRKYHRRAGAGAGPQQRGRAGGGDGAAAARRVGGESRCLSLTAFRRAAAAGGDRACARHETDADAVR